MPDLGRWSRPPKGSLGNDFTGMQHSYPSGPHTAQIYYSPVSTIPKGKPRDGCVTEEQGLPALPSALPREGILGMPLRSGIDHLPPRWPPDIYFRLILANPRKFHHLAFPSVRCLDADRNWRRDTQPCHPLRGDIPAALIYTPTHN